MDNIFEVAISIVFLAVAFISWIIRLVGQSREEAETNARKQRAGQPPARRPPVRTQVSHPESTVRSEIDAFLKQTSVPTAKASDDEHDDIEFEIVPDEEVAAARPQDRGPRAGGQSQGGSDVAPVRENRSEWDRNYESRREQFRASKTGRQLATRPLGAELRETIENSIIEAALIKEQRDQAERELAAAREEIRSLKDNAVAVVPKSMTGARTRDVAAMLKNPQTVRDAIIISEILRPPPGMSRGPAGGRRL